MSNEEMIDLDAIETMPLTDAELAQEAIEEVEDKESADIANDLMSFHPESDDVYDSSAHFRSLMEQIDTTQDEQERIQHYQDALHIFTNTWLGEQGLRVAEVGVMLGGMMVGLGSFAVSAIKSIFVVGTVMYLDHQLPKQYRMGLRTKMEIGGLATVSTAVVGRLPSFVSGKLEDGVSSLLTPVAGFFDGIETALEGGINLLPFVDVDMGISDMVSEGFATFSETLGGAAEFIGAGAAEWFFNTTHTILEIFYNHLAAQYTKAVEDLQELQQQASGEQQEEIDELKRNISLLQAGMTQFLDTKDELK